MVYPLAELRAPADSGPSAHPSQEQTEQSWTDGVNALTREPDGSDTPLAPQPENNLPEPLRAFVDGGLVVKLSFHDLLDLQRVEGVDRKRNRLLSQLVFAARELAEANYFGQSSGKVWCRECQATSTDNVIEHGTLCKTGRVLGILLQLVQLAELQQSFDPKRKEAAPDGERPGAGDGIRPRGLNERVCLKCGKRDQNWIAVQRPEIEVVLSDLGLNQCVGAGVDGKGHTLFTHQCAFSKGGAA